MILSGCASHEATKSKTLYNCGDWPASEIGKPKTFEDRAELYAKGYSAWASCKEALARVNPNASLINK